MIKLLTLDNLFPSVRHCRTSELSKRLTLPWTSMYTVACCNITCVLISADEEAANYQLDVDLSTLTFTHHPLFSKEHVLASRLQQYYKQYTERRRKAMSSHYSDKVAWECQKTDSYLYHSLRTPGAGGGRGLGQLRHIPASQTVLELISLLSFLHSEDSLYYHYLSLET